MSLNLAECFFRVAEQQPDHPLILRQATDDKTSYAEFKNEVLELAQQLKNAGIKQGDNVGLNYPSGSQYIAFVYAIWACNACVTPLPIELTPSEKQQIFEYVHIDFVISHSRMLKQVQNNTQGEAVTLIHQAVLAKAKTITKAPPELSGVNAAFIRFTSGTTGNAKGVVLSHEAIYERIHSANKVFNLTTQDRVLWLLSMDYHFAVSIVAYLTFGVSVILPKNSFGITLLNAASTHKATFIYGSPTHYMLMTQDDSGAELPTELRFTVVTTTALRSEAADAFYERFGRVLNETYGIIELGLPAINDSQSREKQGSVGRITPDYELKLDYSEGQEYGEITFKSKGMLDAYYSPWRSRENILKSQNNWFRTGDLGKLDQDNYLYIVGRSKEMINVGGMKFFPEEVEAVLEKHPKIVEACVFAVQDGKWSDPAQAHLVLTEGEVALEDNELRGYCREFLASHKIPGSFHWVSELTYTASGKKTRNPEKFKHS